METETNVHIYYELALIEGHAKGNTKPLECTWSSISTPEGRDW